MKATAPILRAYAEWAASVLLPAQLYDASQPLAAGRPLVVLLPSRRGAKYRRASNEAQLLQHLASIAPRGSQLLHVDPGSLSFAQQVLLINSVDLVVGMHGAALSLLLYTHPAIAKARDLRVMELFAHDKDRPRTYTNICSRLGIPYDSWTGQREGDEIEVDVQTIGRTLQRWYGWDDRDADAAAAAADAG